MDTDYSDWTLLSTLGRANYNLRDRYLFTLTARRDGWNAPSTTLNAAVGGWQLSGIYTYRSGEFIRFPAAEVTGDVKIDNPGPQKWFNTDAFRVLPAFTPRTNPNQYPGITGPIFWNLDGTVSKTFPIRERYNLEFRFEAYNLTNRFPANDPDLTVTSANFGKIVSQRAGEFGRQIQLSGRFVW